MRTRFAPSPTGPLHLGHAYSALLAYDMANAHNGSFVLRIEDIDQSRSRPHWETRIYEDLQWLGLQWPQPVLRQSDQFSTYTNALETLDKMGVLYHCTCNRRDIQNALSAPQEGQPMLGPDGVIYPGTCRNLGLSGENTALRLDVQKAFTLLQGAPLEFVEYGPSHKGRHSISAADFSTLVGDFIIARRGMGTSYHLSVVLDDANHGITDVIRGEDLFEATMIHVLIQRLMGLPTPNYFHHKLIRDTDGKRLAKRDDARAIGKYRADGMTPKAIRAKLGLATS